VERTTSNRPLCGAWSPSVNTSTGMEARKTPARSAATCAGPHTLVACAKSLSSSPKASKLPGSISTDPDLSHLHSGKRELEKLAEAYPLRVSTDSGSKAPPPTMMPSIILALLGTGRAPPPEKKIKKNQRWRSEQHHPPQPAAETAKPNPPTGGLEPELTPWTWPPPRHPVHGRLAFGSYDASRRTLNWFDYRPTAIMIRDLIPVRRVPTASFS
jgi:hypothetical protein